MNPRPSATEFKPGFDAVAARMHAQALVERAKGLLGKFVTALSSDSAGWTNYHVPNDANAVERMVQIAADGTAQGCNVYIAHSLFSNDLADGKKGTEDQVVAVLGLTNDFDDAAAERYASRMPLAAQIVLQTSEGRYQCTVVFDKPLTPAEAKPLATALKRATGCDRISDDLSHVWRMAGTVNFPSAKKLKQGRRAEPQSVRLLYVYADEWELVDAGTLREAVLKSKPNALEDVRAWSDTPFDWHQRTDPDRPCDPLSDDAIAKALDKDGDRSERAFGVWTRLRRKNYSPEEVFEVAFNHDHRRVMQHFSERDDYEDALRADIRRAFTKPLMHKDVVSRVENIRFDSDEKTAYPPPREIKTRGGALGPIVDQLEAALIEQQAGVFQRGGSLVEPGLQKFVGRTGADINVRAIAEIEKPRLQEHFTRVAQIEVLDRRANEWKVVDCPDRYAQTYLARNGHWNVRVLAGIISAPTLRHDGTLLDRPGYDRASGLIYDPNGVEFPAIPSEPSQDEARDALKTFDELIGKFPFATAQDRAVALSALLTVTIRPTLKTAPMFAIDAPGAGSGKGKLVDTVAVVGTGNVAPSINMGKAEDELEKRIGGMLFAGTPIISIDNANAPIDSATLCSLLTQEQIAARVLGHSSMPIVQTRHYTIFTTGNGLELAGDLNRRALRCLIDPRCEVPSERKFAFDPVERALQDRPRYVAAALTVLRAYQAAGRPPQKGRTMGSYVEWTQWVRDALMWLDKADAVGTWQPVNTDDPEREQFAAVVTAWRSVIGLSKAVSVKRAIEMATAQAYETTADEAHNAGRDLLDAFRAIAPEQNRGGAMGADTTGLGYWLRKHQRRVVNGCRFFSDGTVEGSRAWRLQDLSRSGGSDA